MLSLAWVWISSNTCHANNSDDLAVHPILEHGLGVRLCSGYEISPSIPNPKKRV